MIKDKIINLEQKLSESKKELNDLINQIYTPSNISSKLINEKINSLKNELSSLDYQLRILKEENEKKEFEYAPKISNIIEETHYSQPPNEPIQEKHREQIPLQQNIIKNIPNTANIENKKDLEDTIGKSFMGIFASILIFISIIIFATVLVPLLTDSIKILAMYLFSLGLTAFGMKKLSKNNKNKLYLSITGCGVGSLYISLLLSNIYFEIINDLTLYFFILIWAIFVAYLSRLKSQIFKIIGQCGITIAILFGCNLCVHDNEIGKFFVLNIFLFMTLFIFNYQKNMPTSYEKNLSNNIFTALNLLIIQNAYFNIFSSITDDIFSVIIAICIIGITCYQLFLAYKKYTLSGNNIGFTLINLAYYSIILTFINELTSIEVIKQILLTISAITLLILNEYKMKENTIGRNLFQIVLLYTITQTVLNIEILQNYIGISIILIPLFVYQFFKSDDLFKYIGIALLYIFTFQFPEFAIINFVLGILIYSIITLYLFTEEEYKPVFKILSYLMMLLFIGYNISLIFEEIVFTIFIVISIINLLAKKSLFKYNMLTKEEDSLSIAMMNIINAILMITSLILISSNEYTGFLNFLLIIVSIANFYTNTSNLLKEYNGMGIGIYIVGKFNLLLYVILNSLNAENQIISIFFLLFAIASIILGFILKQKSFRIYGLVLSMISVIKLIMIDISYNSTIEHALSFLISGVLCFVISAIYNQIDKKISKDN